MACGFESHRGYVEDELDRLLRLLELADTQSGPLVMIIPTVKMDTPTGLWRGVCLWPYCDSNDGMGYTTGATNIGAAGSAVLAHWTAKHDPTRI